MEAKYGEAEKAELIWLPNTMSEPSIDHAVSVMKMVEILEDDDDVQVVTTNMEMTEAIMEKLMVEG